MGHSITAFHGVGFTAKDWKLQVWLRLLVREIDQMRQPPAWLTAARNHWHEQAVLAVNGCIDPNLDAMLADDDRVVVLRHLGQRVYSKLLQFGERVPHDFLNKLCELPSHSQYTQDVETEAFLKYGRAFLKLLDGKMTANEFA